MNDELKQLLDKLKELSSEELAQLESDLLSEFDDVRKEGSTPEIVAVLSEIADATDTVRAEVTERETAAAEAEAQVVELEKRIKGETDSEGEGDGDAPDDEEAPDDAETETPGDGESSDGEADAEAPATSEGEKQEVTAESEEEPAADEKKVPVAAAATKKANLGAINKSSRKQFQTTKKRGMNKIVNTVDGSQFKTMDEISKAMIEKRRTFGRTTGGVEERVSVARIMADFPKERVLGNDAQANASLIAAAVESDTEAIVAAGGLCAPLSPYYGLANISDASRPVRAGLTNFQGGADRGGIRYITPPTLPDFNGAVSRWTIENDATPGSDGPATKPCITVDCGDEITANIYAVPHCLTFGNMGARAWPEQVTNATELTLAAHARIAESYLLDAMKAGSKAVTAGIGLGAARDLLYQVGVGVAAFKNRHRMPDNARLVSYIPSWTMDMIREDIARSLPFSDNQLAVADSAINGYFNARGVRVVEYLDSPTSGVSQYFGNQAVGQLLDFPSAVQWGLFHEGAWGYLDGGQLDLGLVRSPELNETNDYQIWGETFEGIAMLGVESLWITSTLCASGASAGTIDPTDLCAGNYVPAGT